MTNTIIVVRIINPNTYHGPSADIVVSPAQRPINTRLGYAPSATVIHRNNPFKHWPLLLNKPTIYKYKTQIQTLVTHTNIYAR